MEKGNPVTVKCFFPFFLYRQMALLNHIRSITFAQLKCLHDISSSSFFLGLLFFNVIMYQNDDEDQPVHHLFKITHKESQNRHSCQK